MRLSRTRILLAVGAVAAAGTVAGSVLAAAPASAGPAAAKYVLVNQCSGKGEVGPSTIWLPYCPSGVLIGHAKWTSWGSVAFGSARLEVDNCTPSASCGPSKYTKYPILMVLWGAKPWPRHPGRDYFSKMTWIFTGQFKLRRLSWT